MDLVYVQHPTLDAHAVYINGKCVLSATDVIEPSDILAAVSMHSDDITFEARVASGEDWFPEHLADLKTKKMR